MNGQWLLMTLFFTFTLAQHQWSYVNAFGAVPNSERLSSAYVETSNNDFIFHAGADSLVNNLWYDETYVVKSSLEGLHFEYHNANNHARPPRRIKGSLVWNKREKKSYLFGGITRKEPLEDCNTCNCCSYASDLWVLGETWETVNVSSNINPPARADHSAVYSHLSEQMIIFGGYSGSTLYNDIWIFDFSSSTWSKLENITGTPPSPRYGHTSQIWDNNMYIFAGTNGTNEFNDMFIFNLDNMTWSIVNYTLDSSYGNTIFEPRHTIAAMAKIHRYQTIFFGGDSNNSISCPKCLHLFDVQTSTFKLVNVGGDVTVTPPPIGIVTPQGLWIIGYNGTYTYKEAGNYCGDKIVSIFEDCDDGNTIDKDGCNNCTKEMCGDDIVNNNGTENCDGGENCPNNCFCDILQYAPDDLLGCVLLCGNGRYDEGEDCEFIPSEEFENESPLCMDNCTCPYPYKPDYKGNCIPDKSGDSIIIASVFGGVIVLGYILAFVCSIFVQQKGINIKDKLFY